MSSAPLRSHDSESGLQVESGGGGGVRWENCPCLSGRSLFIHCTGQMSSLQKEFNQKKKNCPFRRGLGESEAVSLLVLKKRAGGWWAWPVLADGDVTRSWEVFQKLRRLWLGCCRFLAPACRGRSRLRRRRALRDRGWATWATLTADNAAVQWAECRVGRHCCTAVSDL